MQIIYYIIVLLGVHCVYTITLFVTLPVCTHHMDMHAGFGVMWYVHRECTLAARQWPPVKL